MRLMINSMFWEKKWDSIPSFFPLQRRQELRTLEFLLWRWTKFLGLFLQVGGMPSSFAAFQASWSPRTHFVELKFRRKWPEWQMTTSSALETLLLQGFHCATPQRWKLKSSTNICSTNHPKSSRHFDTSFDTSGPSYGNQWFRGLFFCEEIHAEIWTKLISCTFSQSFFHSLRTFHYSKRRLALIDQHRIWYWNSPRLSKNFFRAHTQDTHVQFCMPGVQWGEMTWEFYKFDNVRLSAVNSWFITLLVVSILPHFHRNTSKD